MLRSDLLSFRAADTPVGVEDGEESPATTAGAPGLTRNFHKLSRRAGTLLPLDVVDVQAIQEDYVRGRRRGITAWRSYANR